MALILTSKYNAWHWHFVSKNSDGKGLHIYLTSTRLQYICNGWDVRINGTTSMPKSVLRYVMDKVRLFVPV